MRFQDTQEFLDKLKENPDLGIDTTGQVQPGPLSKKGQEPDTTNNKTPLVNPVLPKESEESWQNWQIRKLQENGWRVHAERPAWSAKGYRTPIQGDEGFPDVISTHEQVNYCLVIENKSMTGSLSPAQEKWCLAFSRLPGFKVLVLRPDEREKFLKIVEISNG